MVAQAAGLGRLTVLSMLGQPLRAEIELTATRDELAGMTAKVASQDAFRLAGVDYAGTLTALKFSIEKRNDGQSYVKLISDRPISEPFVDMLVELSWPSGRLVREYTFLLDPPEMSQGGEPVAAPVEVPQRAAASEPAPAAAVEPASPMAAEPSRPIEPAYGAGPGQIDIKRGDTLSKLANEIRGSGVSLEQMLVAMFRENPGAFMGKNMNRMMAGKILNVPALDTAAAISQEDAVREVRAQAADWNAYRRRLAGVVDEAPARDLAVKQEAAGKIEAKVDEQAPVVKPGQDRVKIAKTETPVDGKPVAGAVKEEDKIAQEKALKDSQERTATLEKNVADLQKLVEIKSQGMAQVQKQAEVAKAPDPAPTTKVEAPAAAPVPAQAAPAPVVPAEAPKTDAAPAAAAAQPAPKPAPKPRPKMPPPPPEEPGFLEEMFPAIAGGVLALLAGVGGFIFYRRRKSASTANASVMATGTLSQPSLGANSVFRATGGQSVDTSNVTPATTDFSQAGPGTIDTDEVDPVAEAEVYMAYGRDAQAEEILLEALQKDPKRTAIHGKLLEIYANRKSLKQFETLATELYAQTGGRGPDWETAAALGAQLDPTNSLYTGSGTAAARSAPSAAAQAGRTTSTVTMPGELAQMAETAGAATAGGGVDFDLGGEAAPAADKQIFDFDLGLGGDSGARKVASDNEQQSTMVLPGEATDTHVGGSNRDAGLSFDFNLGGGADTPVDIELTASQIAPEPIKPEAPVNLSKISLDLGKSPAEEPEGGDFDKTMLFTPGSLPDTAAGAYSAAGDSDGFDSNVQAVATKLDLAKAYQEMGDAEGARELLDEVLAEGSAAQKKAAQEIIARLA
jgi:pilus assembly protein FimV